MIRFLDICGLISTLILIVWLAIPTSLFLQPQFLHYNGRDVIFVRLTPYGDVSADWATEVDIVNSMDECAADGNALYQVVKEARSKGRIADAVRYKTDPRLWPCLDQYGEKIIRHTWVAKLFGIIPLRKHTMIITVFN